MNVVEKRDFIHSHLHEADDFLIDQFYETLRKDEVLKEKLVSRAQKSEDHILNGKVYSREEAEKRTNVTLK